MNRLQGKVAVVTGASKGIGASIAEHLAAEGAAVIVNYAASKAGADAVVRRITDKGGKALAIQADVSRPDDIKRLFAQAKAAYGKLDVLVNNAGIYEFAPLESVTPEHFHKQFNLNVLGLLLATQEAVNLMGPTGGSIINVSSIVGPMPVENASVYSATKAAVDAVTVALSKELGPKKIRVNSLNPGMVETEGLHAAGIAASDFRKTVESQTPLGRIGQPDDIARVAVFYASDDAGWVTERGVGAVGADNMAWDVLDERDPETGATLFAHVYLLPQKGIYIMENLNLEELSRDRCYTFAFIGIPLKFSGATGSPFRPLALRSPAHALTQT